MNNTIEGVEVQASLIQAIQEPHKVPVSIQPTDGALRVLEHKPYLRGHTDGWIDQMDVRWIPIGIRKMAKAILEADIGCRAACDGHDMQANKINIFGEENSILYGIKSNPGLPKGGYLINLSNRDNHFCQLLVAETGYIMPPSFEGTHENSTLICTDTENDWIDRFLIGDPHPSLTDADMPKNGENALIREVGYFALRKPKYMAATAQSENGEITLVDRGDLECEERNPRIDDAVYISHFLEVAKSEDICISARELSERILIALEVFHTLRAIHETLIGTTLKKQIPLMHSWYGEY